MDNKKIIFSELVRQGFIFANKSHKILFQIESDDDLIKKLSDLTCALAYLTEAHSLYCDAEVFLKDNIETLDDRPEFTSLIDKFKVYNREFLNNVRTNHSHQWTDIEFRAFADSFRDAGILLNIDGVHSFVDSAKED
ncbi:hypothetical protein [Enterococcus malodoratus]|uniref:Uncharacterized protein n=1 Tax=Enterococcus malodoratus ATCC 43197 TaxID=1158601 RepID=R2PC36_9ENTE|nr:hypothetical protein [Enterococcus malodoratus]EOH80738.1 hypothetical protein UAI_00778 [Enterococcus malodoratus ATCC 43197]EOT69247.1 hypothetical protein I585_00709 [Enterococcus malodoratus ATCC 43197]SPW68331.1 Uncharacterised protein [Enterococcus malodoratus]STC71399.1 Uncharacterised protein [Enterococcus malodoratus]